MEFRVNNRRVDNLMLRRTVEVCIDDQWYKIMSSGAYVAANNSQSPHNISIHMSLTSVRMMIWSEQSITNDKIITGYGLSCTASALSDGQIHKVKLSNGSKGTTRSRSMDYNQAQHMSAVSVHTLTNTPLDLISSSCVTTKTKSLQQEASNGQSLVIGLGTGLGICSLLLVLGILVGFIVSKTRCSKHDSTTQVFMNTKKVNMQPSSTFQHFMQNVKKNNKVWALDKVITSIFFCTLIIR